MSWILVIMMGTRFPVPTYAEVYTDKVTCVSALEKYPKGGTFSVPGAYCIPLIKG
jgi:hypothetical protein